MPSATVPIASSSADQRVQRTDATNYPPQSVTGRLATETVTSVARSWTGTLFLIRLLLLEFDLPAHVPAGQKIDALTLRLHCVSRATGDAGRNLVAEVYGWDGTSESDYTDTAPASPVASLSVATVATGAGAGADNDFAFSSVAGISASAKLKVRLHIDGGQPVGNNAVGVECFDALTTEMPRLVVAYSALPADPPAAPTGLAATVLTD